jgi:hypothetical protein
VLLKWDGFGQELMEVAAVLCGMLGNEHDSFLGFLKWGDPQNSSML